MRLEIGDTIKCHDEKDLRQTLKILGKDGINAVVLDANRYIIKVNGTKGEEHETCQS